MTVVKQGKLDSKVVQKSIGMGPAQRETKTENGNCTTTYFTDYDLNFHFSPYHSSYFFYSC